MEVSTPDWVKDAVFYQIFPDRFARSVVSDESLNLESWTSPPSHFGFKGGNLVGVCEKLDYLQELGVSVLYFNPIFQSAANHRYHTHDYFRIDPILGGDLAFKKLLDDAHRRGMRVIIDGVFNHASRGFFQFNHTLENGKDSPYKDWFHFNQSWLETGAPLKPYEPIPLVNEKPAQEFSLEKFGYRAWWNIPSLPMFNTRNVDVREFVMRVGEYWIEFGIDGWRLDVPHEIDDDSFWQEFRLRVKRKNPDAYIVGEIWKDARRWLKGDQFDAVTNYLFTRPAISSCFDKMNKAEMQRCGLRDLKEQSAQDLGRELESLAAKYPWEVSLAQMNLLGSHDTPRVLTMASEDVGSVEIATALMFFYVGAPCIYYGDEIGMKGGHDPFCRWAFPWDSADSWDQRLLALHQSLSRIRRESISLRRGKFKNVEQENCDTLLLERSFGDEKVYFAANLSLSLRAVDIKSSDSDGLRLVGGNWLVGDCIAFRAINSRTELDIPGRGWVMWRG